MTSCNPNLLPLTPSPKPPHCRGLQCMDLGRHGYAICSTPHACNQLWLLEISFASYFFQGAFPGLPKMELGGADILWDPKASSPRHFLSSEKKFLLPLQMSEACSRKQLCNLGVGFTF